MWLVFLYFSVCMCSLVKLNCIMCVVQKKIGVQSDNFKFNVKKDKLDIGDYSQISVSIN